MAEKFIAEGGDPTAVRSDGWVARRWNPAVRERLERLLDALGQAFDGRIEGVNLAETSIDFGENGDLRPVDFSYEGYVDAVENIMTAAREAFPNSLVIQYANFMPGEWLPWEDHGYLRTVYEHAFALGIGVGGPDLLPFRIGQLNHSYPLIAGRPAHIVAGIAVQDGNLAELDPESGLPVTVSELERFAREELRADFIFWGTEEPYYSRDILPFLKDEDLKHGRRVALKVLRPAVGHALGGDRSLREIRIAAGLSHPNILPLFDSGDGRPPVLRDAVRGG